MLRYVPPDGRIENRIFLPSNETAGSEILAPVKFVIGVTTPSGAMGESLYRFDGAQLRLSDSSSVVLTNTSASVVVSCWMTSSGALSRQPDSVSGTSTVAASAPSRGRRRWANGAVRVDMTEHAL